MAIVFLTRRSPQKTIPTANFHFKVTLKILPIFYLGFLKKISDKSFSQKLYSKLSSPPRKFRFFARKQQRNSNLEGVSPGTPKLFSTVSSLPN